MHIALKRRNLFIICRNLWMFLFISSFLSNFEWTKFDSIELSNLYFPWKRFTAILFYRIDVYALMLDKHMGCDFATRNIFFCSFHLYCSCFSRSLYFHNMIANVRCIHIKIESPRKIQINMDCTYKPFTLRKSRLNFEKPHHNFFLWAINWQISNINSMRYGINKRIEWNIISINCISLYDIVGAFRKQINHLGILIETSKATIWKPQIIQLVIGSVCVYIRCRMFMHLCVLTDCKLQ